MEYSVDRAELNDMLELLRPGINLKENVPQSAHYVFDGEYIRTFNDEVSCAFPTDIGITGAVHSQRLAPIISKLPDEVVKLSVNENRLIIKGRKRKSTLVLQPEIEMDIDSVEIPEDDEWFDLPPDFTESIPLICECYLKGQNTDHIASSIYFNFEDGYMLASDSMQAFIAWFDGFPDVGDIKLCVRGEHVKSLKNVVPSAVAVTQHWIHFTNHMGMIYSIRTSGDQFPSDFCEMFEETGEKVILPSSIEDIIDRASVFCQDNMEDAEKLVKVTLDTKKIRIEGEGLSGKHIEEKESQYNGSKLTFSANPEVLVRLSKYKAAIKSDSSPSLIVKGQTWSYLTLIKE